MSFSRVALRSIAPARRSATSLSRSYATAPGQGSSTGGSNYGGSKVTESSPNTEGRGATQARLAPIIVGGTVLAALAWNFLIPGKHEKVGVNSSAPIEAGMTGKTAGHKYRSSASVLSSTPKESEQEQKQ